MTQKQHFYSTLPYDVATDRLKHAKVRGVNINLTETDSRTADFVFDLLQDFPVGGHFTLAHIKGTIKQTSGRNLRIDYQSRGLARNSIYIVPVIGIIATIILMILFPPELSPIASVPGVAGLIFAVFWNTFSDEVHKPDQLRLKELLERMLEKQTTMSTWQG